MLSFSTPNRLRGITLLVVAALCLLAPLPGCDNDPLMETEKSSGSRSDPFSVATASTPQQVEPPASAPAPQQTTTIELGSTATDLRRRAQDGDVGSMMVLARWYESRNTPKDWAEARAWYQRAAAARDSSAQKELDRLDAREGVVAKRSTTRLAVPTQPVATTLPEDGKFRWSDVLEAVDTSGFLTDTTVYEGQWMGLSAARDKSITLAAAGKTEDDLDGVTAVVRVKNKLDPAESKRVQEVAVLANRVTRDNVKASEICEWIQQYMASGQRSEPIYRNGWRITVSGPSAEGVPDNKGHLGAAVMVKMEK